MALIYTTPMTWVDDQSPAMTAEQWNKVADNMRYLNGVLDCEIVHFSGENMADVGGTWTTVATKTISRLRSHGLVSICALGNVNHSAAIARVTIDGTDVGAGPLVTIPSSTSSRVVRLQYRRAPTLLVIDFREHL